jgi:hypothetical protein
MNAKQTIAPPAHQPINADARTIGIKWKPLRLIGELLIVTVALGMGFLAWTLGLFMNFIFVLLLLLAPVNLARFASRAWKQKIYFGLFARPFAPESRKYWWPCLARVAFFLACGYLLSIAIVPFQFPDQTPGGLTLLSWGLVTLQVTLALLPAKRVSLPATGLFSVSTIFMVWPFIQIATPAGGETILLSSPMRGASCVVQGGNSSLINHHYALESQRYAVDIFKVAESANEVKDWKILSDDASLGQTIHSPCDGRVAYVEDSHLDNVKGETDERNPAGNYVTIEVAPDRYVMLAHLKHKSLLVKPGDEVKLGQPIAQCGNSGNTSGPHVHMQVQTSPRLSYKTQTVPMLFRSVLRKDTKLENVPARRNDVLLLEE